MLTIPFFHHCRRLTGMIFSPPCLTGDRKFFDGASPFQVHIHCLLFLPLPFSFLFINLFIVYCRKVILYLSRRKLNKCASPRTRRLRLFTSRRSTTPILLNRSASQIWLLCGCVGRGDGKELAGGGRVRE